MVAALVLCTFICFVMTDYFMQSRRPRDLEVAAPSPEPEPMSNIVGGFKLASGVSYHAGHTWAAKQGRNIVRVGLDDFAARLLGNVDQLALPARGRWLRQGEKGYYGPRQSPLRNAVADRGRGG